MQKKLKDYLSPQEFQSLQQEQSKKIVTKAEKEGRVYKKPFYDFQNLYRNDPGAFVVECFDWDRVVDHDGPAS